MELWTALTLGLVGSLHCAGMCGPLALAVPVMGRGAGAILLSRLVYNGGRVTTYAVVGALSGGLGQVLALAGLQRWISIGAGALILCGLALSLRQGSGVLMTGWIQRLKGLFGGAIHKGKLSSLFTLGLINGLLPCGLVYVAAAAAVAAGAWYRGAVYMFFFGMGTMPVMLGVGMVIGRLGQQWRRRLQYLTPVSLAVVGGLLILRGAGLGIPLLSPPLVEAGASCAMCPPSDRLPPAPTP